MRNTTHLLVILILAVGLSTVLAVPVGASEWIEPTRALTLSIDDPVNDQTGPIDVVRMAMDFDPATGRYLILLSASSAAPFDGAFRVNINLYNVDDSSFFQDTVNDYDLSQPVHELELAGTSALLTGWEPGDRVFTNSLSGTPNPPGPSLFRSAVSGFPIEFLTNEDTIAPVDRSEPVSVQVLSPTIRTERLIDVVKVMAADKAEGLVHKLTAVVFSLNEGRNRSAFNQLNAFVNQVNGFIPNHMTESQVQPWLDEVEVIQSLIGA